jgi:NADPH:quinone reductase-like Zn-dependent oxidoreductase
VLTLEDVPDPRPAAGEALVRVRACALNHLDSWQRPTAGLGEKLECATALVHVP